MLGCSTAVVRTISRMEGGKHNQNQEKKAGSTTRRHGPSRYRPPHLAISRLSPLILSIFSQPPWSPYYPPLLVVLAFFLSCHRRRPDSCSLQDDKRKKAPRHMQNIIFLPTFCVIVVLLSSLSRSSRPLFTPPAVLRNIIGGSLRTGGARLVRRQG